MNELHTQVCFDALSVLNNVQYVESVCNLCGASHFTGNCPEINQGTYVPDTPQQSFSRSSVPNGLLVMDSEDGGTCVITSQKFAKGTRFGPLQAPYSCFPIKGTKFPLIIFPTQHFKEEIADIQPLFNARNTYLDTTDENKCNWMIHVNTAKFSNEQNLICYQENYEIYYAAIQDIELGDILKVWYSPMYASTIGAKLLDPSPYDICNNILRQVSIDYGIKIDDNNVLNTTNSYSMYEETVSGKSDKEIALPPVISLMKISSPNYTNFTNTPTPTTSQHFFEMNMVNNTMMDVCNEDLSINFGSATGGGGGGSGNGTLFDCDTGTAIAAANDVLLQQDLSEITSHSILNAHNADLMNESPMDVDLGPQTIQNTTEDVLGIAADSTKFTCDICNRKYATKLTLEKHLRTHGLYLCIVCDKIYHSLNEMQDHECYKKKNKTRPLHCTVCLKLLSNSWSLNRHMKIHRNPDEKIAVNPTEDQSEEVLVKTEDETTSVLNASTPVDTNIATSVSQIQPKPKIFGKRLEEPMECIVCRRPFKNPNALEKHLRSLHTVYTKDPKLVQETRNKVILTNNTAPIKPSIAKALASKLTKKKEIANSEANTSSPKENNNKMSNNNETTTNNNKCDNNTIIIISNIELTNENMFDTQQLLSNSNNNNNNQQNTESIHVTPEKHFLTSQSGNEIVTGLQQPQYDPLSPIVLEQNLDNNDVETPTEIINVPKMIVLKKPKIIDGVDTQMDQITDSVNGKKEETYNCVECDKTFAKKYQLKRHLETHDLVFYTCPYCDKAPLKARSSLKKHFSREHNDKINEWNTSNFVSKQILRDEEKLKELRKKFFEKKRMRIIANDKFIENCKNLQHIDETSTSVESVESLDFLENGQPQRKHISIGNFNEKLVKKKVITEKINCNIDAKVINNGIQSHVNFTNLQNHHNYNNNNNNNNIYYQNNNGTVVVTNNNTVSFCVKKQQQQQKNPNNRNAWHEQQFGSKNREIYFVNAHNLIQNNSTNSTGSSSGTHSDESVISKSDEHEMIDNLFLENLDNLLEPLNGNEYDNDDDHGMQSVNYIQETFQNSFDKIQEKLDAELEVGHEQLKWEDTLKSDDSSDEIMSNKMMGIDENIMLI